ncbi:helix-turn-helix domain-containing protein [Rhodanobacter sp. AS-Z3]|uniref:winged helix-turn-helix transcriptional regulator n=1 Tax=Rhodanobacter sp. AS-Z3 TaxID=3031330 RepID=UPI002478F885|nr:helix-turn-helix domain-containing protein [Rhodanobacter sp. AS-Z3]WEN13544.1 helix-turn-helix domain-containing protein [Rhodanobacter sp. AS-Z3]
MGLPVRKSQVVTPPPACPLTESLNLLRGAWAPNVIWYLSAAPRRFGELRHDIPRISARVLSARLRELEARGMVTRQLLDTSPPSAEYALTELGRELLPAIHALAGVGQKLLAQWGANDAGIEKPGARRK